MENNKKFHMTNIPFIIVTKTAGTDYNLDFYVDGSISGGLCYSNLKEIVDDLYTYYEGQIEYYKKQGMEDSEEMFDIVWRKEYLDFCVDLLNRLIKIAVPNIIGEKVVCVRPWQ